jgi:hypothetical protein
VPGWSLSVPSLRSDNSIMNAARRLCIAAPLLLLGLAAAPLGAGQQPGPGSVVGVLVGVERLSEDVVGAPAGTLRTLWIQMGGAKPPTAAMVVEVADLLVPRGTGFWRLGRTATCAEGEADEPGQVAVAISQYLWAAPVGQRPRIRIARAQSDFFSPERVGPCRATKVSCDVRHIVSLHWVSPDYVSIQPSADGTCGLSRIVSLEDTTRRLDNVNRPVTPTEALGPAADAALRKAFAAARVEYEKDHKDCDPSRYDPEAWRIAREDGHWTVSGWSENHRLCSYGFDFSADIDVSRITGRTDDHARWLTLRRTRPDVIDAHVAPGGRWTIAQTERQLLVLDGTQPALVLPIESRDSIVMVEWATGRNVARWDAAVRRLKVVPPPKPVVVR